MEVRELQINKLKPSTYNPRKISPEALARLTASVEEFGLVEPIVVNKRTGYTVVGGHQRLKVLESQGHKKAPCAIIDIPVSREKALNVALNNQMMAGEYDFSKLADLLQELDTGEFDISKLTGFDAKELERIANWLPSTDKEETEPLPELPKVAISKIGDIWELGKHRIMCGDSTKPEDVERLMGRSRAPLMNTDPPYGIDFAGLKKGMDGFNSLERDGPIENDNLVDGASLQAFLESVIRTAIPHLTDNPAFYLWHPMLTQGTFFAAAAAAAADILIHRQIIWVKPHMVLTRSGMYHWKHELCFYGWIRGKPCEWYGDKSQVSVWELGESSVGREHPTQKPVELFIRPMENHTKQGEVVYEPFSGSGSQLIAAEKLGRRCYAMEIEPRYIDVAVKRWQNFTGNKAKNITRPGTEIE